jgi:hypothetical protein
MSDENNLDYFEILVEDLKVNDADLGKKDPQILQFIR